VDCYLKRHDPERRMVVLQHHPPLEPFMKGWDQFLDILDRVTAGGGVFMLPGEYADLCRSGTLPLEPRALIPDPTLECTMRMALDKWKKPLAKEDLAGIEKCTHLRDANLRGNAITDVKSLSGLWAAVNQEIDVAAQGNPLPDKFLCEQAPKLEAQGLRIHSSGVCDNVLFTLLAEGQGSVEPKPGDYIKPRGSMMTLRARPAQGWKVGSWDGAPGMEDKEEVSFLLPAYCVITARFVPISENKPVKPVTKAPAGPTPKKE
jgi:hypothetical protein